MTNIHANTLQSWERFYRANFVNSLTGFKSVSLIGTVNADGQTNLGVFSSIVHLGSNPPLVGYINRPIAAAPHTLANIRATGWYTINHIEPSFLPKAHQTSARYPDTISEFDAVGLTPQFQEGIPAPFVEESRVKYALQLKEIIPITLNDTWLVIGTIESVLLDMQIVDQDGFLHLDQTNTICSNGVDAYYTASLVTRLPYARP